MDKKANTEQKDKSRKVRGRRVSLCSIRRKQGAEVTAARTLLMGRDEVWGGPK